MAVVALELQQRSTVLDGRPFGAAGAYEKLAGILRFAADPAHPANQSVTDLDLAPRNASGYVESWADFYLLLPADPARGNHRLLLDVPNRSQDTPAGEPGTVSVAQLKRLVHSGGGAGRDRGPPHTAVGQEDLDLHRGVATGVEDLSRQNRFDLAHGSPIVLPMWIPGWISH